MLQKTTILHGSVSVLWPDFTTDLFMILIGVTEPVIDYIPNLNQKLKMFNIPFPSETLAGLVSWILV